MIFILLLVISCKNVKSVEDDDQKLIDLLPDSEKEAFLEVVARRLITEINSKTGNERDSREVREEEMEEQSDFVKRILAEESSNLRRNKEGEEAKAEDSSNAKEEDDIKYEEDTGGHIDLTLRSGKRLKRNTLQSKSNEKRSPKGDEIPVEVIYIKSNEKPTEADSKITNTNIEMKSGEVSDSTDIQVKGLRRQFDDKDSVTKSTDKGGVRSHTVINDYEPDETTENIKDKDASSSKESPVKGSKFNGVTASIYDEDQQSDEVPSDIDENELNLNRPPSKATVAEVTTEITTELTKIAIASSTTTVKLTTPTSPKPTSPKPTTPKAVASKTTKVTTTKIVKFVAQNISNITNNNKNITNNNKQRYMRAADNVITENFGAKVADLTEYNETKTKSEIETLTTTEPPLLNETVMARSVDTDKFVLESKDTSNKLSEEKFVDETSTVKIPLEVTTSNDALVSMASTVYKALDDLMSANKTAGGSQKNETKEVKIFKDLVKALRSGLKFQFEDEEEEEMAKKTLNKLKSSHVNLKPRAKPNIYEVYEIPADQDPFIKLTKKTKSKHKVQKKTLNEEQPYYVPIYNYAPDQVYFNSYNRLGPNDEDRPYDDDVFTHFEIEDREHTKQKYVDNIQRKFKFNRKPDKKKSSIRISKANNAKLQLPLVLKTPKNTEIYFNPNDYLDMDYYFGRSSQYKPKPRKRSNYAKPEGVLPDTDDEDHVTNVLKGGKTETMKDAVRQLLYSRQIFLNMPAVTTVSPESEEELVLRSRPMRPIREDKYQKGHRNSAPEEDDEIAMDYYFGLDHDKQNKMKKRMLTTIRIKIENERKKRYYNKKGRLRNDESDEIIIGDDAAPMPTAEYQRGTIKDILSIYPTDALLHLNAMMDAGVPLSRSVDLDDELKPYFTTLKDMIDTGNDALDKYDWLTTTVEIQSALDKLLTTIESLIDDKWVHPADFELYKYFQYLYQTTLDTLDDRYLPIDDNKYRRNQTKTESEEFSTTDKPTTNPRTKKPLLPRNKHRKKVYLKDMKFSRTLDFIRSRLGKITDKKLLKQMRNFLLDLGTGLYDLHSALAGIAKITTYEKQKWFEDLKELDLKNSGDKELLEILLHLTTSRLVVLLQDAAENGLEDDFTSYIENHQKEVLESKQEFEFLVKLLLAYRQGSKFLSEE